MISSSPRLGIALAFACLVLLAAMPIVADSRPDGFDALGFAFFLSLWQLLFSLPLLGAGLRAKHKGVFDARFAPPERRRAVLVILATGLIFGLSTYVYVLAVEKAGVVSAAIAMQAYPLFAILWETLFLGRRKSPAELCFTATLIAALFTLATNGSWRIEGLSSWFLLALSVPFLWSVAHVIVRQTLTRAPITPAQVTFLRVLVSSVLLGALLLAIGDAQAIIRDLGAFDRQQAAAIMGLVYYLELILWFHAMRHIDVSVASSITVPAPALTMALAMLLLGETVAPYQVAALAVVVASVYGLLFAGARKARTA